MNRKLAAIVAASVVTVGGLGAFVGQSVAAPQSAYPKPVRDYVEHPKGFNDSADVKYGGGDISCPGIKTAKASYGNDSVNVRTDLAPLVTELLRITKEKHGYDIKSIGGYNCRFITNGSVPSNHAYARAVDINPAQNPYSPTFKSDMPPGMVADWMKYGFYWGGHYKNNKDAMHFEYIEDRAKIAEFTAAAKKEGRKPEPTKTPTKKPTATKTPTKPATPKPTATKTPTNKPTIAPPCVVPLQGQAYGQDLGKDQIKSKDGEAKVVKPGPDCTPPPCTVGPLNKGAEVDPAIARRCPSPKPTKPGTATPKPTKPGTATPKPTKPAPPTNTPKGTPTTDPVPPTNDPVPPTSDPVPPTSDPVPPVDQPPVDQPPAEQPTDPAPVGDDSGQYPVGDGSDQAPADVKDSKDTTGGLASTGV